VQVHRLCTNIIGQNALFSTTQQTEIFSAGQVPSFDSRVAMLLLEKELGVPWTSFFAELSPEPIAAASLGQVSSVEVS